MLYQFDDSVLYGKGLTIEILSNSEQRRRHLKENQVAKEVPTWMKVSTVSGAEKDADRGVSKADEIKNTGILALRKKNYQYMDKF